MSCGVIGADRGSSCLLRVLVSQNDFFMEVKLSVFRIHWVSVIALSRPHMNNQFRTSLRDTKILTMFLLSVIKKFIDRFETKLGDLDSSLVGQHVRPLKNNYFKPWYRWCQQVVGRKLRCLPKLFFIRDAYINYFTRFHKKT